MKHLKSVMLVIIGFAIAMLVSFKNEEPKKEYCRIGYNYSVGGAIKLETESKTEIIKVEKGIESTAEAFKLITKLSSEGWKVVSASHYSISGKHW